MATQGSNHGALQNFPFFSTVLSISFVCIFIQSLQSILKLTFIEEHLYFDMSVKFVKFLKTNLENIEILS